MNEHAEGQRDRELVGQVLAGENAATQEFVERMRCVPRILAAKNARSGRPLSHDDLADLAQEVFSIVWRKLSEFRGEARIEAWVYPFCQLQYMNALRRNTRRPAPFEVDGEDAEPDAAGTAVRGEGPEGLDPLDATHVHAALERLSEAEKEVIRMKQFDDLTFDEIAARTGISVNTAKTRYYRGLVRLRDLLALRFSEEVA